MVEKLIKEAFKAGVNANAEYWTRSGKDKSLTYEQFIAVRAKIFIEINQQRIDKIIKKGERSWA